MERKGMSALLSLLLIIIILFLIVFLIFKLGGSPFIKGMIQNVTDQASNVANRFTMVNL